MSAEPMPRRYSQQQAGQQVFGVGAHGGRAGLDHADVTVAAGFQIGVVGAHMHAGHGAQARRKVDEFAGDGDLARQNDGFSLVHGLAQGGGVCGQLGAVLHRMARLQPGQSLRHQSFKK
jgi:hypothetical protein